jgi:hypothetical protein
MPRLDGKKHKFSLNEDQLQRLNLSIRTYCYVAVQTDSFQMLVNKEILEKVGKSVNSLVLTLNFSNQKTTNP